MMSTISMQPKKQIPLMTYILTLGAPFIGFVGASMVLASTFMPSLFLFGNKMMALGPWLTSPAMIRSAWVNKQPSWLAFGVSTAIIWPMIFADGEAVLPRGILIFMVGFLFMGLSNIVMKDELGQVNREFDWSCLKAESPESIPKLFQFVLDDLLMTLNIGIQGILQILAWPINAFKGDFSTPQVLSTDSLWRSRRFGGFFFTLAGLCGIVGSQVLAVQDTAYLLFNILGGLSSLIVNYSLFFTGVKGKHWLTKLLIPGTLLATVGAAARSMTWGFAMDQFGSRLNEMYMCGLPLIGDDEDSNIKADPVALDADHPPVSVAANVLKDDLDAVTS
jgi:hypothetical protein